MNRHTVVVYVRVLRAFQGGSKEVKAIIEATGELRIMRQRALALSKGSTTALPDIPLVSLIPPLPPLLLHRSWGTRSVRRLWYREEHT